MTENDKNKDNIKDLMKGLEGQEDNKQNAEEIIEKEKKSNKPYLIGGLVLLAMVGALAFTLPNYLKSDNDTKDNSKKFSYVDLEDEDFTWDSYSQEEYDKYAKKELEDTYEKVKTPIKMETWQKTPRYKMEEDKESMKALSQELREFTQSMPFGNFTSMLPSEAAGYTSDVNQAELEDGTTNPKYSYLTKENVEYAYGNYTQRLLNPIFGNWNYLPYGEPNGVENTIEGTLFEDMFTPDWWKANISDTNHRAIPIYADWNGDTWGGLDIDDKLMGIFFGEIISSQVDMQPSTGGTDFYITSQVEYSALLKNGKLEKRTGEFHMKLVPNVWDTDPTHRVLIDDTYLKI